MDLELLRLKFEAEGTAAAAAAVKRLEQAVTQAMGRIVAGMTKATKEASALNRQLTRLGKQSPKITVEMTDLAPMLGELDRLTASLRDVRGRHSASVDVRGVAQAEADLLRLQAHLEGMRDKNLKVSVSRSGFGGLGSMVSGAMRSLSGLGSMVSRVAMLTGGLVSAAAAAVTVGHALAGLAGGAVVASLAGVTAGVLGLASAAAVAGAGVAAFAILAIPTIKGIVDAQKAYAQAVKDATAAKAAGDDKAYTAALAAQKAALEGLSPAQRSVVAQIGLLQTAWTSAAKALEPTVIRVFAGGIQTVMDLLPQLVPIADAVGGAISGLMDRARASLRTPMFTDFMATVQQSAPGLVTQFGGIGFNLIGAFANGFTNGLPLIQQVMGSLEGLAGKLRDSLAGDGFKQFVSFGLELLPKLGEMIGSFGHAIMALLKGLQPLATVAVSALTGLGKALTAAFSGDAMKSFVASAAELIPLVGEGLGKLGNAAMALLSALAPLGTVVVGAIGQLADALTTLFKGADAQAFIAALMGMVPALVPLLTTLGGEVMRVAASLMQALLPVVVALAPVLMDLAVVIGDALVAILPVLGDAITMMVSALGGPMVDVIKTLAGTFVDVAMAMKPAIDGIGSLLGAAAPAAAAGGPLAGLVGLVASLAVAVNGESPLTAIGGMIGTLASLAAIAMPILSKFIVAGLQGLQAAMPALMAAFQTAMPMFQQFFGDITTAMANLAPAFGAFIAQLLPALAAILPQVGAALVKLGPSLVDLSVALTDALVALMPLIPSMVELFASISIESLQAMIPLLTRSAEQFTEMLIAAMPLIDFLVQFQINSLECFTAIVGGIGGLLEWIVKLPDTIATSVAAAISWFLTLPEAISGAFADAGTWLLDAGGHIIDGLISGIRSAIPGLDGVLGWITDKIPDWKGPAAVDAKLLVPTGALIMGGFAESLRANALTQVRPALGDVTAMIGVSGSPGGAVSQPSAQPGAGRTIRIVGDYTINGQREGTAVTGSVEDVVLKLLGQHDAQFARALSAAGGGAF